MESLPERQKIFKEKKKDDISQKGQALLIILLVLSVILTTALSIVSRTVTEITISTAEEESSRALSAAEAGIERVLISGGDVSGTLPNLASFETVVDATSGSDNEFSYPAWLESGESATFWMVSHDESGNLSCSGLPCFRGTALNVCWGSGVSPGDAPAVEISFYFDQSLMSTQFGNFSNMEIARLAFDPIAERRSVNSFANPTGGDCTIGLENYLFSTGNISLTDNIFIPMGCANGPVSGCAIMVKVKFFYNTDAAPAGISTVLLTGAQLPAQGLSISSTGVYADKTRKIDVFQSFPVPPVVFESSIFSYGSLEKGP